MKQVADQHRREVKFQPGKQVYLRLQPYRMCSLARKVNEKLAPRFFGPYEGVERIGKVAYKLKLPPTANIYPVFHVSQLKKVVGDVNQVQPLPTLLTESMEWVVEPEEMVNVRTGPSGREVLVK